jgi:hypothetical protein
VTQAAVVDRPTAETAAAPVTVRRIVRGRRLRWHALWWATPIGSLLLVVPLSLLVTVTISGRDYVSFYRVQKAVTTHDSVLFLLAAGVLLVGVAIPMISAPQARSVRWPGLDRARLHRLDLAGTIAFRLTVLGYVLLGALGAARGASPVLLLHALTSQSDYGGTFKTLFAPVAGITSLTQVGIAYTVIAALLRAHGTGHHTGRRLAVVFVLGLFRAYFLTERLAILELIVPWVLVAATTSRQRSRRARSLLPAVPLLALPLLTVVFGAFEYSRSWQYFKSRTTLSFPQFVVNRLAGYYATSYNNGALQLQYGSHLHRLPYDAIQGFWTAPGIAELNLYQRLTGFGGDDLLNTVLAQHGNPEFNNPGGLAVPLIDFGLLGGLLFFLVAGLVVGLTYRAFRSGRPLGLLVYPVLFTGLLELPRYVYWTEGRVVPAYLVLLAVAYALRERRPAGTRRLR